WVRLTRMRIGGRYGSCAGAHVRTPGRLITSGRIDLGSLIPRPYALRRSRSAVDPMADPTASPQRAGELGSTWGSAGKRLPPRPRMRAVIRSLVPWLGTLTG